MQPRHARWLSVLRRFLIIAGVIVVAAGCTSSGASKLNPQQVTAASTADDTAKVIVAAGWTPTTVAQDSSGAWYVTFQRNDSPYIYRWLKGKPPTKGAWVYSDVHRLRVISTSYFCEPELNSPITVAGLKELPGKAENYRNQHSADQQFSINTGVNGSNGSFACYRKGGPAPTGGVTHVSPPPPPPHS